MRPDGTPAVSLDLSYARQHATRPDTRSRTRASTVGCCWGGPTPGEKHQWWRWPSRLGDSVGPEDIAIKHDPRRRPHTTRRASSMPISAVRSADEYRRDGLRGSGARLRPSIGTENNSVHYLSVSHYQPLFMVYLSVERAPGPPRMPLVTRGHSAPFSGQGGTGPASSRAARVVVA